MSPAPVVRDEHTPELEAPPCDVPPLPEVSSVWPPVAEQGGVWDVGCPKTLTEALCSIKPGDQILLSTDGAVEWNIQHTAKGPYILPVMGAGWAIGVGPGPHLGEAQGQVRTWVACGHVKVPTPAGDKASSYVAEVAGVVAGLRALGTANRALPDHIRVVLRVRSDSQSMTLSLPSRSNGDNAQARNSPARCWWTEIRRRLNGWRRQGKSWSVQWVQGHPERRKMVRSDWTDAEIGNSKADRQASLGVRCATALCPLPEDLATMPGGRWFDRDGAEWLGGLKQAMQKQAADLARERYMSERLEKRRVELCIPLADLGVTTGGTEGQAGMRADERIWTSRGGRGPTGGFCHHPF